LGPLVYLSLHGLALSGCPFILNGAAIVLCFF
jgi:hypothetical protein